jgi:hypothetical protein
MDSNSNIGFHLLLSPEALQKIISNLCNKDVVTLSLACHQPLKGFIVRLDRWMSEAEFNAFQRLTGVEISGPLLSNRPQRLTFYQDLQVLRLEWIGRVDLEPPDLQPLSLLPLELLELKWSNATMELDFLSGHPTLHAILLDWSETSSWHASSIPNLAPLGTCAGLRSLKLRWSNAILPCLTLNPLAGHGSLRDISLDCDNVWLNLTPLSTCPLLETIRTNNRHLDFEPLDECPHLHIDFAMDTAESARWRLPEEQTAFS